MKCAMHFLFNRYEHSFFMSFRIEFAAKHQLVMRGKFSPEQNVFLLMLISCQIVRHFYRGKVLFYFKYFYLIFTIVQVYFVLLCLCIYVSVCLSFYRALQLTKWGKLLQWNLRFRLISSWIFFQFNYCLMNYSSINNIFEIFFYF